ncbi:Carboxyvinyl-carboxyphosphonate phosphorylmutase, chloroplastic [Linum grandiflorum]
MTRVIFRWRVFNKSKNHTLTQSTLGLFENSATATEMSTLITAAAGAQSFRSPSTRQRKSTYPTARMQQQQNTRFHRLIEEKGIVLMPGCYDALSAAIVQKTGFSAGFVSGYALSASLLAKPDFGLLTPPEMAAAARLVCSAAPQIPIIADADTGGGNALNVQRTTKDLIAAGAAGCFLEDQAWPKRCGHMRGKQVIPAEEHAAKIASARDAIGDSDFFLVARTDARATSAKTGLSDAISRANLYMEAPRDDKELKEIGRRTKGYRVCNMLEGGVTPLHTPEELKEMGFHLIVHPLTSLYASARALIDVLKTLKEKGTTRDELDKMATFGEFNQLVNLESWFELESKFARIEDKEH